MKNINLLVWVTQLGLSVAVPLAGFILLAVWARNRWELGQWVILVGVALGVVSAVDGLRQSLKILSNMSKDKNKEEPPVSFNDHE